eukprot:GHVO01002354.1.p2 GENE.GHVO01002354.1~~GHVO01002354.1.p2  ORF type:complete len:126 (-),score=9.33 GHVO01002354.1:184-561(-)
MYIVRPICTFIDHRQKPNHSHFTLQTASESVRDFQAAKAKAQQKTILSSSDSEFSHPEAPVYSSQEPNPKAQAQEVDSYTTPPEVAQSTSTASTESQTLHGPREPHISRARDEESGSTLLKLCVK